MKEILTKSKELCVSSRFVPQIAMQSLVLFDSVNTWGGIVKKAREWVFFVIRFLPCFKKEKAKTDIFSL